MELELELELKLNHMTQKPMLRVFMWRADKKLHYLFWPLPSAIREENGMIWSVGGLAALAAWVAGGSAPLIESRNKPLALCLPC